MAVAALILTHYPPSYPVSWQQWEGELHASLTPAAVQAVTYNGEQVSFQGSYAARLSQSVSLMYNSPAVPPVKLVGEFTLPLVPDGDAGERPCGRDF